MHDVINMNEAKSLKTYDPEENRRKIVVADDAERLAIRQGNLESLGKAVWRCLEERRDFAAHYKAMYSAGRPKNCSPSATIISARDYCRQYGTSIDVVNRWAKLLDPQVMNSEYQVRFQKAVKLVDMIQSANFSSESVEWYTPSQYIESARICLGKIDLDPASSEKANETVRAETIYTANDDALTKEWHGKIFMNPPYGTKEGKSLAGLFCDKAISEYEIGHVMEGVILVNSVHSQNWQASLYNYPVCFVNHRIQFVSGDGEENKNPTFGNIFVYFGKDKKKFANEFSAHGYCMERICE